MLATPTSTTLRYNATYSDLTRPVAGPANPFRAGGGTNPLKRKGNVLTGHAEETAMSAATFATQHRTWQSQGYAADPGSMGGDGGGVGIVGDMTRAAATGGKDVVQMRPSKEASAAWRAKRQRKGDAAIVEGPGAYLGPWAPYQHQPVYEDVEVGEDEEVRPEDEYEEVEVPEDEAAEEATIGQSGTTLAPMDRNATAYSDDYAEKERSEFHGTEMYDYQGRTYMHVPQDLDVDLRKEVGSIRNYIPKRLVHTWPGHGSKPVTSLRFFPGSGHLLLSSGADAMVRLWDVYHERSLLRDFAGHNKAISDMTFHPTGATFLSASYDRHMKLWDTEYGKCIGRFGTGKTPHVVRFNPDPAHWHEFLAGMSDKKIVQFDTRTGSLVQEYDHHLAAVNTLTFVDGNRRFISTSDDKSLRAWEYGIPVPIKFVAEPYMFAMVRSAPHPSGKYVAFQASNNEIVVYAATDKFRQHRRKLFRGHNNAGYAIDVACSPDGQFIASGDTGGYVCFWDWKTGRMYHKFQAGGREGAATTCLDWHPQETSKVATAGLDGVIRYWD